MCGVNHAQKVLFQILKYPLISFKLGALIFTWWCMKKVKKTCRNPFFKNLPIQVPKIQSVSRAGPLKTKGTEQTELKLSWMLFNELKLPSVNSYIHGLWFLSWTYGSDDEMVLNVVIAFVNFEFVIVLATAIVRRFLINISADVLHIFYTCGHGQE
jgi:hypothetical protein